MLRVRSAGGDAVRAPRAIGHMGDVVSRNLSSRRRLWTWKTQSGLNDGVVIGVNKIALRDGLVAIDMGLDMSITNGIEALLLWIQRRI